MHGSRDWKLWLGKILFAPQEIFFSCSTMSGHHARYGTLLWGLILNFYLMETLVTETGADCLYAECWWFLLSILSVASVLAMSLAICYHIVIYCQSKIIVLPFLCWHTAYNPPSPKKKKKKKCNVDTEPDVLNSSYCWCCYYTLNLACIIKLFYS